MTLLENNADLKQLLGSKYDHIFQDVYFDSGTNIYFSKPIDTDFDEITIEEYLAVHNRPAFSVNKTEIEKEPVIVVPNAAFKSVRDMTQLYLRIEALEKKVNLLTNKHIDLLNTF